MHVVQLSQELCIARTILYCRGKVGIPYCSLGTDRRGAEQQVGRFREVGSDMLLLWTRYAVTAACSDGDLTTEPVTGKSTHTTMLRSYQN